MADLGEYLQAQVGRRRQAGVHDCCTMPANWAIECGRPDPMERWRGAYATEAEGEDLIAAAGGLNVLFGEGLAGLAVRDDPRAGDIGVVEVLGEQAGAIFTGKRWALVAERGLAFATFEPEAVLARWRP